MRMLQILRRPVLRLNKFCFEKAALHKALTNNSISFLVNSSNIPSVCESRNVLVQITSSRHLHLSTVKCDEQTDKSKEHEVLVYVGPLRKKIKVVKALSLTTSALGLGMFPAVLYNLLQINVYVCVVGGLISSVFLCTPLLLHHVTKRYVVELHFNTESKIFTARTLTLLNHVKELKFTADDVYVPTLPGFMSSFCVKKTPLFVDYRLVEDPDAYSHMMGFDKPLDILMHSKDEEKLKTEQSSEKS